MINMEYKMAMPTSRDVLLNPAVLLVAMVKVAMVRLDWTVLSKSVAILVDFESKGRDELLSVLVVSFRRRL